MTIPTHEIQALRDRAQEALDPLPYQQARLHIGLERERPVRFEAVEVDGAMLYEVLRCMPSYQVKSAFADLRPESRGAGHWPAAQIVELCDAVLEQRSTARLKEVCTYQSPPDDLAERSPAVDRILDAAAKLPPLSPPWRPFGGLAFPIGRDALKKAEASAKRAAERIREQQVAAVHARAREQVIASLGLPPGAVGAGGQPAPRLCSDCKGPRRGSLACERCSMVAVGGVPLHLASGEGLDRLGELVGVERACDTDRQYRARIELEATDGRHLGAATRPMAKIPPERHHPPLPHRFQIEPDRQSRADPEPASGESLEFIGKLASVARRPHEADADYRARLDESIRRPMAKVGAIDGVKARTFAASDVKATLNGVELEPAGDIVIEPVQPGEPTEAERRERLRREMTKGRW
jgi:hypothetical protein